MKEYNNLLKVSKPLRYAGGEIGSIVKDPKGKLKICLTFPDIYEIGMSHLGLRILYSQLNAEDSISCERMFAPWPDAYEILGSEVMVSLENKIPAKKFDVYGISLQYELSYTTALQMLKMSCIPLLSINRTESDPIVISGGCCSLNPAPLSSFIDVFCIGEMDIVFTEAMKGLHKLINKNASRTDKLQFLNQFSFMYVPLIEPEKKVIREIHTEFPDDNTVLAPLVPNMAITQDRIPVEVSRGCTNGCRFCQAGVIYRPVRERKVSNICQIALDSLEKTGYQEVSLLSLDTGDYTSIESLISNLGEYLSHKYFSMSLPSLRADTVTPGLLDMISSVRKSGFTIAPEAGSQRLRDIINKNLSEEEILNAALYAKEAGYNGVKLYFMCGLPYETDEDIIAISELAVKLKNFTKGKKPFNITVSVSNFVPKPHTPFERFGQNSQEELRRKHNLLYNELRYKKIKLKIHNSASSVVEAAISRGDLIWEKILLKAVEKGFYLDAWSEFFSDKRWSELFSDCGTSLDDMACKNYADDDKLPWEMIDTGVSKKWLLKERDKAADAVTTKDCRTGNCSGCGVCKGEKLYNNLTVTESFTLPKNNCSEPTYKSYKMIYDKLETSSLMAALDLSRIFKHMLLSTGIRLQYSQGFNPMPKMAVMAPTSVSIKGINDSLYFYADLEDKTTDELVSILNTKSVRGLIIKNIIQTPWPKNMSDYIMKFQMDEQSFSFMYDRYIENKAAYNKEDKKGYIKAVLLKDYLIDLDNENKTITLKADTKGSFHFLHFFRHANYQKIPDITRIEVYNIQP